MNEIICGDVIDSLKNMSNNSVDLILTSPPYWNQRKYETENKAEIGNENTYQEYLQIMGKVFAECYRVCKDEGSIVFNIGDKYVNGNLLLLPYRFATYIQDLFPVKLVNDITWIKTNPTPRQFSKRLISATEPFFHFVKTDRYYYNRDAFLEECSPKKNKIDFSKKGEKYRKQIENTNNLNDKEKKDALYSLSNILQELADGSISDFRMKIRGIHKKAFGGQPGGRNSHIEKKGYTLIRMYGKKLKRDVIECPVANSKGIDHPAIFPINLIKEIILLLSNKKDIVLDPFCGSGQTCIAAKILDRNFIGIDISESYCKIAQLRTK